MASSAALSPKLTTSTFLEIGVARHNSPVAVNFVKAFMGGLYLSLGGLLALVAGGGNLVLTATYPGLTKFITAAVFPVGLIMIILTGSTLVTGEMCLFSMAVMKRRIPIWSLPYNIVVAFFGNLFGSLWVAGIFGYYSGIFSGPYAQWPVTFAVAKVVTPTWGMILVRGYGCNFLVCMAVWQATQAQDSFGKIVAAWFPIFVFVFLGYDHVVANMLFIPLALMIGTPAPLDTGYYIWKSMIPSLIGNYVGALTLALPLTYLYLMDYAPILPTTSVMEFSAEPKRFFGMGSNSKKTSASSRVEEGSDDNTV